MLVLVVIGALLAGFAAVMRGRRAARRHGRVAARRIPFDAGRRAGRDSTIGLRDPARSL